LPPSAFTFAPATSWQSDILPRQGHLHYRSTSPPLWDFFWQLIIFPRQGRSALEYHIAFATHLLGYQNFFQGNVSFLSHLQPPGSI
jgi:hypothetical protein